MFSTELAYEHDDTTFEDSFVPGSPSLGSVSDVDSISTASDDESGGQSVLLLPIIPGDYNNLSSL